MKPNEISESEVRITDIRVRSALIRVRWNDMPVRRDDSSTDIWSEPDLDVTPSAIEPSPNYISVPVPFRANHQAATRSTIHRKTKYGMTASRIAIISASTG